MIDRLDHGDGLLELRLARPPVNALDPALTVELTEALRGAPADGARALVLSGARGLYSAGLDVPHLLTLDREHLSRFWGQFSDLLRALAGSPVPIAAAITGHAPAGGTVLAAFCDYRVMAMGDFRMGFTEAQVGLPVPRGIYHAFERLCGPRIAARYSTEGRIFGGEEALAIGLVDELVPEAEVVPRAAAWCRRILDLPSQAAVALTREYARAELMQKLDEEAVDPDDMSRLWLSEDTQRALRGMVERVRGKRG